MIKRNAATTHEQQSKSNASTSARKDRAVTAKQNTTITSEQNQGKRNHLLRYNHDEQTESGNNIRAKTQGQQQGKHNHLQRHKQGRTNKMQQTHHKENKARANINIQRNKINTNHTYVRSHFGFKF